MIQSKRSWVILAVIASIVIAICSVAGYYMDQQEEYGYHLSMFPNSIPCSNLFAPSALQGINTMLVSGRMRKTDQIYTYIYDGDYYILIWKIASLKGVDPRKIPIQTGVYLDNVKLRGEILDVDSPLQTEVRYGPFLKDTIVVDLDEYSKISDTIEGLAYRGFYGTVSKLAFENGKGQIVAMENYTEEIMHTLFVMYKGRDSFYMIIINSRKPFGPDMLKLLNLKK